MTACDRRHRGPAHACLLDNTSLLFDRVVRPGSRTSPQLVCRDNLFEDAHPNPYVGTYDVPT